MDFITHLIGRVFFGGIVWLAHNLYFRLRYPNKYLRAKKIKEYQNREPYFIRFLQWVLICIPITLFLLLFYKLIGI